MVWRRGWSGEMDDGRRTDDGREAVTGEESGDE
jgi:hypothetical protein